jgi:hypothetical protein
MVGYRLRSVGRHHTLVPGTVLKAVFRIRDFLVRIRMNADPDLGSDICLMDPAPDPTLFFSDLEYANKVFMLIPF